MIVGLISDTHGLLRPQAIAALQGSSVIIHAGDVGKPEILERLRAIAPTFAVRGNIDTQPWASALPDDGTISRSGTCGFTCCTRYRSWTAILRLPNLRA